MGGSGGVNDNIPPLANRQVQFAQSIQNQPVNFMQQQTPPSNSVSMNSAAFTKNSFSFYPGCYQSSSNKADQASITFRDNTEFFIEYLVSAHARAVARRGRE